MKDSTKKYLWHILAESTAQAQALLKYYSNGDDYNIVGTNDHETYSEINSILLKASVPFVIKEDAKIGEVTDANDVVTDVTVKYLFCLNGLVRTSDILDPEVQNLQSQIIGISNEILNQLADNGDHFDTFYRNVLLGSGISPLNEYPNISPTGDPQNTPCAVATETVIELIAHCLNATHNVVTIKNPKYTPPIKEEESKKEEEGNVFIKAIQSVPTFYYILGSVAVVWVVYVINELLDKMATYF
jgi:hypothetical protein